MRSIASMLILFLILPTLLACEAEDSEDDSSRSADDDDSGDDDDDSGGGNPPVLEEPTCPEDVYIGSAFTIQAGWSDPDGDVSKVHLIEYWSELNQQEEISASDANIPAGQKFGVMVLQRDGTFFEEKGNHMFELWLEDAAALTSGHVYCDINFMEQPGP